MAEQENQNQLANSDIALIDFNDQIDAGVSIGDAFRGTVLRYPADALSLSEYASSLTAVGAPGEERENEPALLAVIDSVSANVRSGMQPAVAFLGIVENAKRVGISLPDLASKLQIALSVLSKLDQRMIDASTIPSLLIDKLASELKVGATLISAYLSGGPKLASNADYKSPNKAPRARATQQTFAAALQAAVNSEETSIDERDFWLSQQTGEIE